VAWRRCTAFAAAHEQLRLKERTMYEVPLGIAMAIAGIVWFAFQHFAGKNHIS